MTVRALFEINTIAVDGTNPLQLNITLLAGNAAKFTNYSAFQNETAGTIIANADLTNVRRKGDGNNVNVTTASTLRTLKLICRDEKDKQLVLKTIRLKNRIKGSGLGTDGAGANSWGVGEKWQIMFEGIKYDANATFDGARPETFLNIDDGAGGVGDNTLTLRNTDYDTLGINGVFWTANAAYAERDRYGTQLVRLVELQNAINDITDNYAQKDAELRDETTNKTLLETIKGGVQSAPPNAAKDIDYTLSNHNDLYQGEIERLLNRINEFEIWKKVVGLETVDEVLKFNAAGFNISADRAGAAGTIATQVADILKIAIQEKNRAAGYNADDSTTWQTVKDFFPSANKTYRGFEILKDENIEVISHVNADNATHVFNRQGRAAGGTALIKFTKTNIDNFRGIFRKKRTTDHADYGGFDENSGDKWDFRGFEPGDTFNNIANASGGNLRADYGGVNIFSKVDGDKKKGTTDVDSPFSGGTTLKEEKEFTPFQLTKGAFDVLVAGNLNDLLGFFYKDFDGAPIGNKQEVLEMYLVAAQRNTNVNYATDNDNRKEINDSYKELKNFLTYFDVDYTSYDKSRSADLDKAKVELYKYINARPTDALKRNIFNFWQAGKSLIGLKITEIDAALKKDPQKDPKTNVTKPQIIAARDGLTLTSKDDDFKKKLKLIFDDTANETELLRNPKAFLDDLVKLVELIDKAYTDGGNLEKSTLEAYSGTNSAISVSDDKKKMWGMVNNDRIKDKDNKKLGDTALNLATKTGGDTPEQKLAKANKDLKDAIVAALGKADDGDTVFNNITKGKSDNTTFIEQAAQIINEARNFIAKSEPDARRDLEKFENFLKTKDSGAQTAVNTHLKTGNVGYITAARNRGKKLNVELEKAVENAKLGEVKDRNDAKAKLDAFKNGDDYNALDSTNQSLFDSRVTPWTLLLGVLKTNSGQEAKELVPVLQNLIKKPDIKTAFADSKDSYNHLKEKLDKLEKYKKTDEYGKLTPEDKTAFDALLKVVKERTDELAKTYKESDNTTDDKKPFFKSPLGITLIIVIVIAVLGLIAWLIKSNSSEEGEGESE